MSGERLDSWWPFDIRAFSLAESALTDRQSLARIRLLNYAWQNRCLVPLDGEVISRICKAPAKVWLGIMREFTHTDDGWRHDGLLSEYGKALNIAQQRREAGRRSGEARRTTVERPFERPLNHACDVPVRSVGITLQEEESSTIDRKLPTLKVVP